jgi:hypothetical protein
MAMLEMSAPVAKIWDGVLFAPIVGIKKGVRTVGAHPLLLRLLFML